MGFLGSEMETGPEAQQQESSGSEMPISQTLSEKRAGKEGPHLLHTFAQALLLNI